MTALDGCFSTSGLVSRGQTLPRGRVWPRETTQFGLGAEWYKKACAIAIRLFTENCMEEATTKASEMIPKRV